MHNRILIKNEIQLSYYGRTYLPNLCIANTSKINSWRKFEIYYRISLYTITYAKNCPSKQIQTINTVKWNADSFD